MGEVAEALCDWVGAEEAPPLKSATFEVNFICANCGEKRGGIPRGPSREEWLAEWCEDCWRTLPDDHILKLREAVDEAMSEVYEAEDELTEARAASEKAMDALAEAMRWHEDATARGGDWPAWCSSCKCNFYGHPTRRLCRCCAVLANEKET